MAVRFVIGRAGTGKTRHCFETARQECRAHGLRARVLLLLPPQGTFMAERHLACERDDVQSLAGVQVVSFESLTRELGSQDARLAVSPQGRRLVLSHLLRQHAPELQYFGASARQAHLAARVDAALAEMEAAGVTLDEVASAGSGASPTIENKLRDLKLLQRAWEAFLGQERVDPQRRLADAAQGIAANPSLRSAVVLVDGFVAFSEAQRKLLRALATACRQLDICLLMDPASPVLRDGSRVPGQGLFHRSESAYLKLREGFLKEGIVIVPPLLLETQHRLASSAALCQIERGWHAGRSAAAAGEVLLLEASSPRQEVEQAARLIRQWQRENVRLRNIGVFVRHLDAYRGWIGAVFGQHQIPCFIDHRRPMAHHALLRLVRGILSLLRTRWRQETVIELLKCGLLPITDDEASRLENFALLHGIDGARWAADGPWHFLSRPLREDEEPTHRQQEELQESLLCDALRRKALFQLRDYVNSAGETAQPLRQRVSSLYQLLAGEQLGLRAKLVQWIENARSQDRHDLAAEHVQAWTRLMCLFDEAVELLGDAQTDVREFAVALEAAMEGFDLAITPPTLDQVLVGQIDRSRSPEFKRVIVLGLSEGVFPVRPSEDCIFSDAERQVLLSRGIDLGRDSLRDILDERLLGYLAFTRASETLVLSRHTHNESGAELPSSPFLAELRRLVQLAAPPAQEQWLDPIETPAMAAQQLGAAVQAARTGQPLPPGAGSLFNWLTSHPGAGALAEALWRGVTHANSASLSSEFVSQLFHGELQASVSRLEAFAACPFRHFAGYTLHLREREVAKLANPDLGNVFHAILEQLVRRMVRQRFDWDDQRLEAALPQIVQEVGQTIRGQLMLSSQRNRYLLEHIETTVRQIIAEQRTMREKGSRLLPREVEVSFGASDRSLPSLDISGAKGTLHLSGRIDRVDVIEERAEAAIYDYKLHGKSLKLDEVYHGLALQLLTYLLVLREHGVGEGPLTPVAAFYLELLRKLPRVESEEEAAEPQDTLTKPRGVINTSAAESLGGAEDGKSAVFAMSYSQQGPRTDHGDLVFPSQFDALLDLVKQRLGEMSDQVLAGEIAIRPYMLGRKTPCSWCDYRRVCRFEPSVSGYRLLSPMKRQEVLEKLAPGAEAPDA